MPCYHKFIEDLNLEKLDFEPTTLIVGTFNPDITGNTAEWFYGRTDNNFWDVLQEFMLQTHFEDLLPEIGRHLQIS